MSGVLNDKARVANSAKLSIVQIASAGKKLLSRLSLSLSLEIILEFQKREKRESIYCRWDAGDSATGARACFGPAHSLHVFKAEDTIDASFGVDLSLERAKRAREITTAPKTTTTTHQSPPRTTTDVCPLTVVRRRSRRGEGDRSTRKPRASPGSPAFQRRVTRKKKITGRFPSNPIWTDMDRVLEEPHGPSLRLSSL